MSAQRYHHFPQPAHIRRARYISFKMKPLTVLLTGVAAVAICGWAGVVTTYTFFRDDVLIELVSRQHTMDKAYKDTINTLRTEIDALHSKRMVERATFSDRLELLHKQQAVLEQRHTALTALVGLPAPLVAQEQQSDDNLTTGVISSRASKPRPMGESIGSEPLGASEDENIGLRGKSSFAPPSQPSRSGADLAQLEARFSLLVTAQNGTTAELSKRYETLRALYVDAYQTLGVPKPTLKTASLNNENPMGGPFIPLPDSAGKSFSHIVQQAKATRMEAVTLRDGLRTLPLHNPAPNADYTSSFGVRTDPFLGTPAFHSGIDFRVSTGTPIYATANGTVTTAGWNGGYGIMVEIDHGQGYTTRYGHLQALRTHTGEQIQAGQIIGLSGSTGRSTGPHLHYETRIHDKAINPVSFLKVAQKLEGLL